MCAATATSRSSMQHPGAGAPHPHARIGLSRRGDVLLARRPPARSARDRRRSGADLAEVEVCRRPRLTILSTGDELAEPGTARERAGRDSGKRLVRRRRARRAMGRRHASARTACATICRRCSAPAEAALERADIVVVTGGASVGEKDFAKAMFEPLGLELVFSKVAIKPGKPVWLGRAGEKLVIGLPGNPTSALVTARLLLAPLARRPDAASPSSVRCAWRTAAACGRAERLRRARNVPPRALAPAAPSRSSRSRIRARRRRWPKPTCWSGSGRTRRRWRQASRSRCSTSSPPRRPSGEQQLRTGDGQDEAERTQQPRARQPLDSEPCPKQALRRRPSRGRSATRAADARPMQRCRPGPPRS